jgi:flagellar basal body P-ring formation protein FlgA
MRRTRGRQGLAAQRRGGRSWRAVCKSVGMSNIKPSKFRRLRAWQLAAPCASALLFSSAALAQAVASPDNPLQSIAAVRNAAEEAVRSQLRGPTQGVHVHAADLDARLHLGRCPIPVTGSVPMGTEPTAHMVVRVSCTAPHPFWSVYVPVNVESDVTVLVLKQAGLRGARLGADDVSPETRRVPGFALGYITDVNALAHRTLNRSLPAGTALTADALLADFVIRSGQEVTLVAATPGISVRAAGRALEDGREGAHVRAQNLASLKVVQGVVDASGMIEITP